MKPLRFAVAGYGHIGKRHAAIIQGYDGCELVGIADTNPAVQEDPLYPAGIPFFSSFEDLLGNVQADVFTIATPNGQHCSYALKALERGNHVVIEKPMGISKADCEEVIFKSLQVGKQVFVVKQNRYSPPSQWMKEVISKKIIGEILMVQVNCYWNRDDRYYKTGGWKGTKGEDGGTLFTQFSHFIDIMYWLFGDIRKISTVLKNFTHKENTEFEDSGFSHFEFNSGGIGSINFSTSVWDKNMESSITVIGSKGSFKVGGQYLNEVEYCHIRDYTMPQLEATNPPNDYGPFKGSAANHHYVIENVVNTLSGSAQITANALEGMKVVDIIERIYEAAG